ncbi:MAG: VOC family protein [Candidatus Eremiobacteraeota bacterium]|nr:VOC family protein [Candidatus Eremiobacteraeota bacterium]
MATSEKTLLSAGSFCWADLNSTDPGKTRSFYTELMGWTLKDVPMGEGPTYTMVMSGEHGVGGMYAMDSAQKDMGVPSHWMCYILVDDLEAMTKKAADLGATVVAQPFSVGQFGTMSVLVDPTGANFALWKSSTGEATAANGVGTLCWNELLTEDTGKASDFYTKLLDWTGEAMPMANMNYTVFKNGQAPAAGMMELPAEAKKHGAKPHWLLYVSVADCDQTIARCKELGGGVCMPATDFEGVGRGAILTDPTGAAFGVIRLNKTC